jgi:hypothetical protein
MHEAHRGAFTSGELVILFGNDGYAQAAAVRRYVARVRRELRRSGRSVMS